MAGTFHPAEEGDFKPLREKYKEPIKSTKAWSTTSIPQDLEGKMLPEKLYEGSSGKGKLVFKGASDEELKKTIFALHDVFHEIVGLCEH